jgi:hypothetical protein
MLIYMPAAIIFFSFLFLKKHGIFAMNISITLFVVLLPQLTIVTFARSQVPSRTIAVKLLAVTLLLEYTYTSAFKGTQSDKQMPWFIR